jgi:hypothetical protein
LEAPCPSAAKGFTARLPFSYLRRSCAGSAARPNAALAEGDVLLGDDAFAGWAHLALILQAKLHSVTPVHLRRLLEAAPRERRIVYLTTLATGLRRAELGALVWGDARLDSLTPYLKLRGEVTKARRSDSIALKAEVAKELAAWKPNEAADTDRIFPAVPTMDELRADLAAAGIPYHVGGKGYAALHGQRKTLGTLLNLSGAPERVAMEQLRVTDRRLLDEAYTDSRVFEMAAAVERLPTLLPVLAVPEAAVATGTDGKASEAGKQGEAAVCVPMRLSNAVSGCAVTGAIVPDPSAPAEIQPDVTLHPSAAPFGGSGGRLPV